MPALIATYQPQMIEDVIALLTEHGDEAKVVAGGTALTILLRQGLIQPTALVSIAKLPALDAIRRENGELILGALVTHRAVERSALVRSTIPGLARAFEVVANVRVRNAATVGGVMAEADYASDPPAALLALDAAVDVRGPAGDRAIQIADFFRGFYQTALESNELVTGVRVPIPTEGTRAVYEKFVTRSSEDRPCIGVFASVRMEDGVCRELRIAVGAASETPQRFPDVEAQAVGQPLGDEVIRAVADGYAERIDTIADLRGSSSYRTEMVRVWVRRAIERAQHAEQREVKGRS